MDASIATEGRLVAYSVSASDFFRTVEAHVCLRVSGTCHTYHYTIWDTILYALTNCTMSIYQVLA